MSLLSPILRGGDGFVTFWCPGCNEAHAVTVRTSENGPRPSWMWNGCASAPTFQPSILITCPATVERNVDGRWTGGWIKDAAGNNIPFVCHSFVTDGRVQFLSDCTHALAGQTVNLPEWPVHAGSDSNS